MGKFGSNFRKFVCLCSFSPSSRRKKLAFSPPLEKSSLSTGERISKKTSNQKSMSENGESYGGLIEITPSGVIQIANRGFLGVLEENVGYRKMYSQSV